MRKFLFLLISLAITSYAGIEIDKVAQTGCKFLDVGFGARACGMGEAYTVVGHDADALFYNPSCIAEIDNDVDISGGVTYWIADIRHSYLSIVYNTGNFGSFGISVVSPNYGEILGTEIAPETEEGFKDTDTLGVSALCVGVAYAKEFTEKFTVGAQIKYVAQHLAETYSENLGGYKENEISTLSYDFGLLFYPGFKSFAFGMFVRNFSPRVKYEQIGFELPLTFSVGVGVDNLLDFFGSYPGMTLTVGAEMLHPRDWREEFNVGGEFGYNDMIFFRAGYKFRYSQEGLNFGVGLKSSGIKIDWSYSEFKLFDWINRFSVGFSF
ncbi:MAG: PorV/PorQ family protein [candidate division WOR-3 bacterium]